MYATIHRIPNLEIEFGYLEHNRNSAAKFELKNIEPVLGAGGKLALIEHHQGACKCDGNENYIVTGSVTGENLPYFYIVKNGEGAKCVNGKDYYLIKNEKMQHPGGIQVAEKLLAVGLEQYNMATTHMDRSTIMFYDIADEHNIQPIPQWTIDRKGNNKIASAIGLTRINGQWIMAVRAKKTVDFYVNNNIGAGRFTEAGHVDINGGVKEYQQLFLYQDDLGSIYMIGMPDGSSREDKCWLHKLPYDAEGTVITMFRNEVEHKKTIHFKRSGDGPRFMFAAGISFSDTAPGFEVYSLEGHVVNHKIRCNRWK